jgi:predicted DCC family thiol-disulfide oxidoreductase YuxK
MPNPNPKQPVEDVHLMLYDGMCGLCAGAVQFILPRDRRGAFQFASLQSAFGRTTLERFGLNPDDLTTFYLLPNYRSPGTKPLSKGRAALFVAKVLGWPWKAAAALGLLPAAVLDWGYDLVARNRYRLFGRREECFLPRPEDRGRFLDLEGQ